ncbi:MAG: extracellular solute-binding protein [Hyphomicrobiales bacterium]|nr:extracellular solute-binding protein [Hyphomicrobiales bacterium]
MIFRCVLFFALAAAYPLHAAPRHGVAMHGEPKHGPDFAMREYVNPQAPKGGAIVFARQGSFDNLNPFIPKGEAVSGVRDYVFESLMARAQDEPFSLYGLLAESIETPDDRSSATFVLRAEARFSDGKPVTPEDVIFSHALLREQGRPNHREYYSKVSAVERVGERGVKFTFNAADWEMPLIMGLMPVLPRHLFSAETFGETTLSPLVGSGPYRIAKVDPGKAIVYERDKTYWGRDLPINRGLYNFDEIRYDYYRDSSTMFEAFKRGLFHVNAEQDPSRWAKDYDFPAVRDGRVRLATFETRTPAPMTALVFNTRRPIFADIRVREALSGLLDHDWINKNLYFGLLRRTESFFDGSHLAAPPEARPPSWPTGDERAALRRALALLKEAGYENRGGRLVNAATGEPFAFEMLAVTREQERLFLTYKSALERAGVSVAIRQIDSAQMQRRRQQFDFDMIQNTWASSLSPGNEQSFRWSSAAADAEGSFNYAGVKDRAVDAAIAAMLAAREAEPFAAAVRKLDEALLRGRYVIPLFHAPSQWIAHWAHLKHPPQPTLSGARIDAWWREGEGP